MEILGINTIGATPENWNNDQYIGCKFTAPDSGLVSSISIYCADAYGGGFNTFSVSIKSVTAGLPDVVLSSGSGAPLSNVLGWQSCAITPISVVAGTEYFIQAWGEVAITLVQDTGASNQAYEKYFVVYNVWDTPFSGTNYNLYTKKYSMKADIVPSYVYATMKGVKSIKGISKLTI